MSQCVTYSGHAIMKMFARGTEEEDVLEVINNGNEIEDYPDDTPYPSKQLSGRSRGGRLTLLLLVMRRLERSS